MTQAGKEGFMLKEKSQKNTSRKPVFIVRLEDNRNAQETYRVPEDLYWEIKEQISSFRSFSTQAKPVRCLETGDIFHCARNAAAWLYDRQVTTNCSADSIIKAACHGKRDGAYGYHWEFVK